MGLFQFYNIAMIKILNKQKNNRFSVLLLLLTDLCIIMNTGLKKQSYIFSVRIKVIWKYCDIYKNNMKIQ